MRIQFMQLLFVVTLIVVAVQVLMYSIGVSHDLLHTIQWVEGTILLGAYAIYRLSKLRRNKQNN